MFGLLIYLSIPGDPYNAVGVRVESGRKDDIFGDLRGANTGRCFHITQVEVAVFGQQKEQAIFNRHLKECKETDKIVQVMLLF